MAQKIKLSPREIKKYLDEGLEFYKEHQLDLPDEQVDSYVRKVIDKCMNPDSYGWDTAPNSFRKRFDVALGKDKIGDVVSDSTVSKIKKGITAQVIDTSIADEIIAMGNFTTKQKKILKEKVRKYQEEFDFNLTSDKQLLTSLIVEEYQLASLNERYLQHPDKWGNSDETIKKKCHEQILKLQEALGITRQQRDSELEKSSKSIAELSASLDDKLPFLKEQEIKLMEEELSLLKIKEAREPVNAPLTIEEMENILAQSDRDELTTDEREYQKEIFSKLKEIEKKEQEPIQLPDAQKL